MSEASRPPTPHSENTAGPRRRRVTYLILGIAFALAGLLASCGGDDDQTSSPATPTASAADGQEESGSDGSTTPGVPTPTPGFVLNLNLDEEPQQPEDGLKLDLKLPTPTPVPLETEPPPAAPTPKQESVVEDPVPLETVIIDDRPETNSTPSFQLDENAALACANTEFALDALIADDSSALDNSLNQASAWASQSGDSGMQEISAELATTRDLVEAERLVLSVLQACTAAGYEL